MLTCGNEVLALGLREYIAQYRADLDSVDQDGFFGGRLCAIPRRWQQRNALGLAVVQGHV